MAEALEATGAPFESLRERARVIAGWLVSGGDGVRSLRGVSDRAASGIDRLRWLRGRPLLLLKQERVFWHTVDFSGATVC